MPWYLETPKENFYVPTPRCNTAMVVAKCPEDFDNPESKRVPIVVVYGGDVEGAPSDDAYRYDVAQKQWLKSPFHPMRDADGKTHGHDRPPKVSRHTMVLKDDDRTVIVYGGVGPGNKISHDVFLFDAVKFQSKRIETHGVSLGRLKGNAPRCPPLYGHTSVMFNGDMYVFGGRDARHKYNDVYRLAVGPLQESWTWHLLECSGTRPPKTVRHTAVCQSVNMVCTGGDMDSTVYVLRLGSKLNFWSIVKTHGEKVAPPLAGAQACVIDNDMVLVGGVNKDTRKLSPNMWMLDLSSMEWRIDKSGGMEPDGRVQHSMANFNSQFFMFAGENSRHDKLGDLFRFDGRKLAWMDIEADGESPAARCGHEVAFVGHNMYVVGGAGGGMTFTDIFQFDTRSNEWTKIEGVDTGPYSTPTVLLGHSVVSFQNKLWIFGGGSAGPEGTKKSGNQLRTFQPGLNEWRLVADTKGSIPPPCLGHRAAIWGNRMYTFAGFVEQKGYVADIFSYDFLANNWIAHQPGGSVPEGRVGHAFVIFRNYGVCFGGSAKQVLVNNVFVLDMKKMQWSSLSCTGSVPRPRHSHSYALVPTGMEDASLWIFGGRTDVYGKGDILSDTFNLRFNSREISQYSWVWENIDTTANSPPKTAAATFTAFKGVLFLFGGDVGNTFVNKLYNLNPANLLDRVSLVKSKPPPKAKRVRRKRKIVMQIPEEPPEPRRPDVSAQLNDDLFQDYMVFTPAEEDEAPIIVERALPGLKGDGEDDGGDDEGEDAELAGHRPAKAPPVDFDMELITNSHHDVLYWLKHNGLSQHAEAFNSNEIDLPSLVLLENQDLLDLGVKTYGQRNHILNKIEVLRNKYEKYLIQSEDFHVNPFARHIFATTSAGKTYQLDEATKINHHKCLILLEAVSGQLVVGRAYKNEDDFDRDYRTHEKYNHPTVCTIVDKFRDETLTCVMVYDAGGGTLASRLKNWTPSFSEVRSIMEDLISMLEFLHDRDQRKCIVHMDPLNLVFAQNSTHVKLFDTSALFNIGKTMIVYPPGDLIQTTCMSMPPEVANMSFVAGAEEEATGTELTMKPRSSMDIWGLGYIMATLLGVAHYIHGVTEVIGDEQPKTTSAKILARVCNFIPSTIERCCIEDELAKDLVVRMLQPNPKRRPTLSQIKDHPFFVGVGEGKLVDTFNKVVVRYEGMHSSVDNAQEKTDIVLRLQEKYGGRKEYLRSNEELEELSQMIEKELQIKLDAARGARRRNQNKHKAAA